MSNKTPLHNEAHKALKVTASNDFSRFKAQHLIPVVVQEFAPLAAEFPIVFVKNSDNGQFIPVALMGLKEGENLYCQTNEWHSPVTPLGFRNAPFSLAKASEDSNEATVCIDLDDPQVNSEDGQALFDDKGEQTEFLKNRSNALLELAQFSQQTTAITQYFAQKDLLVSQQLTVKLNEQPLTINGLYLIDEKKLAELATPEFEDIRSKGLLPLIYAHLNSLQQINRLTMKQLQKDK